MKYTIPVAAALLTLGCGRPATEPAGPSAELFREVLDNDGELVRDAWATAVEPREFAFPRDHGAHPEYRIEWWYYTGNIASSDGRRFGYQLTFFRTGLKKSPQNPSRWAVRDLYTAHFAVSDLGAERHRFEQRSSRAGIDHAGADAGQLKVWHGDWRLEARGDAHHLVAEAGDFAIDLLLTPSRGPVLHGDRGLSQKGAAEGNASYYYSFPRMETTGAVTVDGAEHAVTGLSWMDHEFSTSFLEPGQVGWDWFSIQLDDDSQLMLYQMRRDDGSVDPYSSGTLIDADGGATPLSAADFTLTPLESWRSDATEAEYPLRWRIEAPTIGLSLTAASAFEQQEMATDQTTGISYWEGSIRVTGLRGAAKVSGDGYLELTGYTGIGLGSLLD